MPLALQTLSDKVRCDAVVVLSAVLIAVAAPSVSADPTPPIAVEHRRGPTASQAYDWMEALLFAIRHDAARPPVHARNIYHLAAGMFDAWAVLEGGSDKLFVGSGKHSACAIDTPLPSDQLQRVRTSKPEIRRRVVGQVAWRLLRYRYARATNHEVILAHLDAVAAKQNLIEIVAAGDYFDRLGAQIARCVVGAGRRDNSNEDGNHANLRYAPANAPLNPHLGGNKAMQSPSRWQPLSLSDFYDQSGHRAESTDFVGAEWGRVKPFALEPTDATLVTRDRDQFMVYHDPGPPPFFESEGDAFSRQFALVALWSGHLDPGADDMIDVAPRARSGALSPEEMETDPVRQLDYYAPDGGLVIPGPRHADNFPPQLVPRGDYTRVIAEYWADGPDSETPPGHWISLYNNHVSRYPGLERRIGGVGPVLEPLDYDIIAYLALGGALHDAAIAAWSAKSAYDYVRPISAIRYLSGARAESDHALEVQNTTGLPIVPGRIERIELGDPLAERGGLYIGETKLWAWRGPASINDPELDVGGVGWVRAREWWPYQRPNFVTPPFAGYVSGHSTFSRAAAVVLEHLTGSPNWPGGHAGFTAKANDFLVFERGPGVDITLQWATYRDAADETGLSRVWGGIHPPVDDLAGRKMGVAVGEGAWQRTVSLARASGIATPAAQALQPEKAANTGVFQGCSSNRSDRLAGDPLFWLLCLVAVARMLSQSVRTGVARELP